MWYSTIVCCLVLIIQGCSTLKPYPDSSMTGKDGICQRWLESIEDTFEQYDLNDPETVRFIDFPHLRANRFLASMGERTASNDAFSEWLEEMRKLDSVSKTLEFANLPAPARRQLLSKIPVGGFFEQALEHCGKCLNEDILNKPEHKDNLLEQAHVPDAYQSWKRVVGLYLLTRYAADVGIERLHRELNTSFKIPLAKLPGQGKLIRYSPPHSNPLPLEHIAAMLKVAYDNPLGIPHLTSSQLQQLLAQFAPVWEIDARNDTDKIGTVTLDSNKQPRVDIKQPTVYVAHAYTRWRSRVVLQLIYQIWLPAREKTGILDLYGGPLDSVIWRVTLSPEGSPIAFDSIHGCGCYYYLPQSKIPGDSAERRRRTRVKSKTIATFPSGHQILLRLQTRTHYLQQTSLSDNTVKVATRTYIFHELEQLRALQMPNGTKRSLYGEDGIIDASERAERFLLWPYGVASPALCDNGARTQSLSSAGAISMILFY